MPTYLVRIIETHDLVGVFSADNIVQLIDIVDECTEPDECEYTRMGPGGIMWGSPAIPIPIAIPEDADGGEPDPMPWGEASVTETWWDYFYGYATYRWKRFFPDEPPRPKQPTLPQRPGPGHVVPFRKKRE
ncbi:hypothetical protein [Tardiphaga sp. 768_D3_N2_1]|uniref:hypothetical protein n=1 Tax=Tardiphaga sp. 768_D3_N2_1 TaxID=3240783 RepID=UPI003F8A2125